MTSKSTPTYKVIIIGAGFSGICLGIKLKQARIENFIILEKADEVGGTWRENTYPGAECDIPSALYSYSFEHNARWQFKWSEQSQIFAYQKSVAEKYGLYPHIHFGQEVRAAAFQQQDRQWLVSLEDGRQLLAQHLVTAVGQLHRPAVPDFPGQQDYQGIRFHSARWDHSVDLSGRRIAVIGNAASAVQFIPQIAPKVRQLTIFQRSANWVLPKQDRRYKPWEQWLSDKVAWIAKLYRLRLWLRAEVLLLAAMRNNSLVQALLRQWSQRSLKQHIKNPQLIAKLTPDYPVGAKRVLFSDDYYATLARDNVYLDTSGIEKFTAHGILRKDGVEEQFDVVIYGTGFNTNPFLAPMDIRGVDGKPIHQVWSGGAHAYLGVCTHGFPNLHMLYGPNTNLGHNSIIIMIEAQSRYIVECISGMDRRGISAMDIKAAVERDYNDKLQAQLQRMAFYEVDHSWYMDGGKVTNNWSGSTWEYRRRLRHVPWQDYEQVK